MVDPETIVGFNASLDVWYRGRLRWGLSGEGGTGREKGEGLGVRGYE